MVFLRYISGIITIEDQEVEANVKLKIKTRTINEVTGSESVKKEKNHLRHNQSQRIWDESCEKKSIKG